MTCKDHTITITTTADGSSTLCTSRFGEQHYHSLRGAEGEALHVFIRFLEDGQRVLEVGFGSGLNALLSLRTGLKLHYTTVELYPIDIALLQKISFNCLELESLHKCKWGEWCNISSNFSFRKLQLDITSANELPHEMFDIVFFDAFAPDCVPQQWSVEVFAEIAKRMPSGGKLLTYSAKGVVKRALREAGFVVKRLPGALGKHNMVMATKM